MAAKRKRSSSKKKAASKRPPVRRRRPAPRAAAAAVHAPAGGGLDGSGRQLVIVPSAGLELAAHPPAAAAFAPAAHVSDAAAKSLASLSSVLQRAGATAAPLFSEAQLMPPPPMAMGLAAAAPTPPAVLGAYQVVRAADERLDDLAAELIQRDLVAGAYVKPRIFAPIAPISRRGTPHPAKAVKLAAAPGGPAIGTPDFSANQGYLGPSPAGVDARWAWTQPGGRGEGVSIVDIEGGWRFTHEDLTRSVDGLVGGTAIDDIGWRNHGTAVLSEIAGDQNAMGVTGIAPGARVAAISHTPQGSSSAILAAARRLQPGDIMLLEMHRPGPRFAFQERPSDQRGYIAVEWWPDDYDAVVFAVRKGVIVVSAAGNGAENLDDPLYSVRPNSAGQFFPPNWINPFDRTRRDSGSIVVGAGAPATGSFGNDRGRLDFSNFGALVDAQGWGRDVVACGYGDLQNGQEDRLYTSTFSGTSSASPIVVGALACVQGIRRAAGRPPLTPAQVRALLRATGAPQQNGIFGPATQRIGNRPNIKDMVASMP
jgi:subtilisin family serine protease